MATFAPDGPTQCSGLDVMRYSPDSLDDEFGGDFELIESLRETHPTPFGTEQKFIYCYCRKIISTDRAKFDAALTTVADIEPDEADRL